jgi:hypothetical protein
MEIEEVFYILYFLFGGYNGIPFLDELILAHIFPAQIVALSFFSFTAPLHPWNQVPSPHSCHIKTLRGTFTFSSNQPKK